MIAPLPSTGTQAVKHSLGMMYLLGKGVPGGRGARSIRGSIFQRLTAAVKLPGPSRARRCGGNLPTLKIGDGVAPGTQTLSSRIQPRSVITWRRKRSWRRNRYFCSVKRKEIGIVTRLNRRRLELVRFPTRREKALNSHPSS